MQDHLEQVKLAEELGFSGGGQPHCEYESTFVII